MSLLTDLFSQLGQNYTTNSQDDEQQRQAQIAQEREAYLARLQQEANLGKDPFWGQTKQGQASAQKAQAELDKMLALRDQGYPSTTGQQIAETIGLVGSDLSSGRDLVRFAKTEGQSDKWTKFQEGAAKGISLGAQTLAGGRMPLPKHVAKSIPKPMSLAPEEAGLIAKASGAKPVYGAAQKATAKAGATASPQELRSFTNAQANAGGDVGAAIKDAAAKPVQGPVLPKEAAKALKQEAKVPVAQAATPPAEAAPKTKWQQVKKGVGSAAKVAGIGGAGYMLGRNWDENAGLPAQPAPAAPTEPEQSLEQYIAGFDLNKADKLVMPQQPAPAQVQEPSFLEKLLQQVLTQGQQSQREGSLTEEQLLQRMESMMNQPQPPPPQVPDNKPKSTLGMVMDALGRGLIAGGTGQADPDAAQKLEMERMTTNQNLAQNARKLTPQQEMTMQMLQSLLGNKMQQGNIVQQGAQSQQNALIQAIVASQLGKQELDAKQAHGSREGQLDRESAERIAGTRSAAAAQKAAAIQQLLESLSLGGAQAPAGPQVNFGQ